MGGIISIARHLRGAADRTTAGSEVTVTLGDGLSPDTEESTIGLHLGRYMVIGPLGRGGMATVHAAYDPKLDRRVAIKIIRQHFGPQEAERLLLREAQSLAQLSHPNIVTVHDVGIHQGRVFLVMEHVQGVHLRRWYHDKPRSIRQRLHACIEAGHGLAEVHRAGIVHCDIKPDNILMGDDGQVRVADFGLARLRSTLEEQPRGPSFVTPGYLAPEVGEGGHLGPATDIFAFCMTAAELLTGERPAPRARDAALTLPHAKRLPSGVERILARGLSADPDRRPRTMDEVVAALQRASQRPRRLAVVGAIVAATAGVAMSWNPPRPSCETTHEGLADHWAGQRASIHNALVADPSPLASTTADQVDTQLSEYVGRWSALRVEACETSRAMEASGQYSEPHARRVACLEQRKDATLAWIDVLADADANTSAHLTAETIDLPPLESCDDVEQLSHHPPPPADGHQWTAVAATRRNLGEAAASRRAGMLKRSTAIAAAIDPKVAAIDYAPLRAEVELERGRLARAERRYPDAEIALYAAVEFAERSAHDLVRLSAWIELTDLYSSDLKRLRSAEIALRAASASLEGAGNPPYLRAQLDIVHGRMLVNTDRFRDACNLYEQLEAERPESIPLDTIVHELGWCSYALGDFEQAEQEYERAYELRHARLGDSHPAVGDSLLGLGRAQVLLAHYVAATDHLLKALRIYREFYGEHSLPYANALSRLGVLAAHKGDLEQAQDYLEQAAEIVDRDLQHESAFDTASILSTLGSVYSRRGFHERARERLIESRTLLHDALGPNHSRNALAVINLAYASKRAGDPTQALLWFQEASQLIAPLDHRKKQQTQMLLEQADILWDTAMDPALALERAQEAQRIANNKEVRDWLERHPADLQRP